jgi:hypothetical protein
MADSTDKASSFVMHRLLPIGTIWSTSIGISRWMLNHRSGAPLTTGDSVWNMSDSPAREPEMATWRTFREINLEAQRGCFEHHLPLEPS